MQQLNKRQQRILDYISRKGKVSNLEIRKFLGNEISRFTVLRDLNLLFKKDLIKKEGKGRTTSYSPAFERKINFFFDPDLYFRKEPDERSVKTEFDLSIVDSLSKLFTKEELKELENYNKKYLRKIKKIDKSFFQKETERLAIELSWKSSKIEGNTYSFFEDRRKHLFFDRYGSID